ncbi:hypothetical protein G4B88_029455 [Cannabis sativa]|uniref:Uncharacterized protein n=1 Tax=Cannabis sativa TaxID=3483 RepID=A0A7J6HBM0_CANSA|nr:hypothetical protein G4B88_029455 [Cannabis sativa]
MFPGGGFFRQASSLLLLVDCSMTGFPVSWALLARLRSDPATKTISKNSIILIYQTPVINRRDGGSESSASLDGSTGKKRIRVGALPNALRPYCPFTPKACLLSRVPLPFSSSLESRSVGVLLYRPTTQLVFSTSSTDSLHVTNTAVLSKTNSALPNPSNGFTPLFPLLSVPCQSVDSRPSKDCRTSRLFIDRWVIPGGQRRKHLYESRRLDVQFDEGRFRSIRSLSIRKEGGMRM